MCLTVMMRVVMVSHHVQDLHTVFLASLSIPGYLLARLGRMLVRRQLRRLMRMMKKLMRRLMRLVVSNGKELVTSVGKAGERTVARRLSLTGG